MALVDYSDSGSSDDEKAVEPKRIPQPTKGTFQKVVDRSNPGKIRVSLPTTAVNDDTTNDEPPAKRTKTGGGAFSSFNSFLPAPKRTGLAAPKTLGGGTGRSGGLGSGVSLKTGAAPAFSRNPEPEFENEADYDDRRESKNEDGGLSLPPPKSPAQKPAAEVKLVGKPLMFKPLSVARKPQKKKPVIAAKLSKDSTSQEPSTTDLEPAKAPPQKVSLFSVSKDMDDEIAPEPGGEYKPMLYGVKPDEEKPESFENAYNGNSYNENAPKPYSTAPPPALASHPGSTTTSNSLDSIASDLHLSASERRQLFGRQGSRNITASKVINFNTDEEYRNNEELRSTGEQVVHNPVRAIAPGKHSLKQLVNAAASQKDALEESFAKGYANRKEASGRYGW